jgi:hypothetical protein
MNGTQLITTILLSDSVYIMLNVSALTKGQYQALYKLAYEDHLHNTPYNLSYFDITLTVLCVCVVKAEIIVMK